VLAGNMIIPPPQARRADAALDAERRRKDFGERREFMVDHARYRAKLRRDRRKARKTAA
jgi:hypothetical protein